ncbi:MAG: hypothetical protein RIT04_604 [Candidatus Parcubacteria bacterium]|jgi:glycosyltransferase involved in cell wall biosynthesis
MIQQNKTIDVNIVLPCLNEEKAIPWCLDQIKKVIESSTLSMNVIIVDNDSTDASATVIQEYARANPTFPLVLTQEKKRGYGSAYQKGFSIAQGKYVFMADLDGTYDFGDIPRFIKKLDEGFDLVVGNRFTGNTLGSMPWHHRYIGNPLLSGMVRLFFDVSIKDIHCGARAIRLTSFKKLSLVTGGMEFASEMIVRAAHANLSISEIPITYTNRIGVSKLHSFRDGWRHMRFILLYSPLIIFLVPGISLFIIGLISMILLYISNPSFLNLTFYFHPMFLSSGCMIAGYQLIFFALFAKTYAIIHMNERNKTFESLFQHITLERTCLVGSILFIFGLLIYGSIFYKWIDSGFGPLHEIKNSIVALTLLVIGIQTISSAFMLSIVSIKEK